MPGLTGRLPAAATDVPKAYLFLAETDNDVDPAEADELARLLREYHIPIAVLNACQSGRKQISLETSLGSRLLQAGTQTVMAMGYSVTVSAAALMMQTLYQSLLRQHDLLVAFREARAALHHEEASRPFPVNTSTWKTGSCPSSTSPRVTSRPSSPCGRWV